LGFGLTRRDEQAGGGYGASEKGAAFEIIVIAHHRFFLSFLGR
jgi:hypothetical protein